MVAEDAIGEMGLVINWYCVPGNVATVTVRHNTIAVYLL